MKIIGAMGLLFIVAGVREHNERREDILFILGSSGLLAYSIYLKDPIFIPLQAIFIIVTGWELWQLRGKKESRGN